MNESEHKKDFTNWIETMFKIESQSNFPYFNEGEIWNCSIGSNIGSEQDGKGKDFWRPVVIVKKYNREIFTGIPLTTKTKEGITTLI